MTERSGILQEKSRRGDYARTERAMAILYKDPLTHPGVWYGARRRRNEALAEWTWRERPSPAARAAAKAAALAG